jgi:hypothetical protein
MPDTKQCEHFGKFKGVGQSVVPIASGLLVICTSICGECGMTSTQLNTIPMGEKKSSIVVPDKKIKL